MASVPDTDFTDLEPIDEDEEFGIEKELSTPKKKMQEEFGIDEELEDIATPLKPSYNELEVGRIFNTVQEAYDCYERYAGSNGFSLRKRTANRSKLGVINGLVFACCCEGTHKRKYQTEDGGKVRRLGSTSRTGCNARIRLKLIKASDSWQVTIFDDVHNHHLVTPGKQIHLKSNKCVPNGAKLIAEHYDVHNIHVSKVVTLFGDRDKLPFDNRDLYNHMKSIRKINDEEEDAEDVKKYFQKVAAENSLFYYAIQCDEWGN